MTAQSHVHRRTSSRKGTHLVASGPKGGNLGYSNVLVLKLFCKNRGSLSGKERRFEFAPRLQKKKRYAVPAPPRAIIRTS